MTTTLAPEERNHTNEQTVIGRATAAVADIGVQVQTAAADATALVADHAPAALAASRDMAERVVTNLRGRSDATLTVGTIFAAGLSGGMLVSRAPRLIVAAALLATMLIGGTLLGRGATGGRKPSRGGRT